METLQCRGRVFVSDLLKGVLKQRLPGHVDLYVAGQGIGLDRDKTKLKKKKLELQQTLCRNDFKSFNFN